MTLTFHLQTLISSQSRHSCEIYIYDDLWLAGLEKRQSQIVQSQTQTIASLEPLGVKNTLESRGGSQELWCVACTPLPVVADAVVVAAVIGSSNSLQFFGQQVSVKPGGNRQHPASVTPHVDVHLVHLGEVQLRRTERRESRQRDAARRRNNACVKQEVHTLSCCDAAHRFLTSFIVQPKKNKEP